MLDFLLSFYLKTTLSFCKLTVKDCDCLRLEVRLLSVDGQLKDSAAFSLEHIV